ncbi:MAG TPA: hypothetical protein ENN28_03170 [Candidatus Uhrbacteria bacterium]|mgnify:CR=1 FL=1|nr:hypothetical protein [Candidatus Uhrbacteria bacterium]
MSNQTDQKTIWKKFSNWIKAGETKFKLFFALSLLILFGFLISLLGGKISFLSNEAHNALNFLFLNWLCIVILAFLAVITYYFRKRKKVVPIGVILSIAIIIGWAYKNSLSSFRDIEIIPKISKSLHSKINRKGEESQKLEKRIAGLETRVENFEQKILSLSKEETCPGKNEFCADSEFLTKLDQLEDRVKNADSELLIKLDQLEDRVKNIESKISDYPSAQKNPPIIDRPASKPRATIPRSESAKAEREHFISGPKAPGKTSGQIIPGPKAPGKTSGQIIPGPKAP